MNAMGLKPDKSISKKNKIWCPTNNSGVQSVFVVDSWAALVLEDDDEGEDDNKGLTREAREFSRQLRRVKGRLTRKQTVLLGTNQIRENPMARFGPKEYEVGGISLKMYSDVRNGLRPVVPKDDFIRDKEARGLAIEPSIIEGKNDHYAFKNLTNIKNKYGRPLLKGMIRIWVSDYKGRAYGIDPVFDTYEYLRMTGQLKGSIKRGFYINHKSLNKVKFNWIIFKKFIVSQYLKNKKLEQEVFKEIKCKKFKLREWCIDQINSGKYMKFFQDNISDIKVSNKKDLEED